MATPLLNTTRALATADLLNGYGLVAGARADLMPNGPERESMRACARRAHWLAQKLQNGEDLPLWQFVHYARQIDNEMTYAGARQLAPHAEKWIDTFSR